MQTRMVLADANARFMATVPAGDMQAVGLTRRQLGGARVAIWTTGAGSFRRDSVVTNRRRPVPGHGRGPRSACDSRGIHRGTRRATFDGNARDIARGWEKVPWKSRREYEGGHTVSNAAKVNRFG